MANIPFRKIWCVDFEFRSDLGENPWVVCMVACELNSGRKIQLWRDELLALWKAPFDTGPDAALVAYYSSAELGCFLELGWPLPANVIDLFAEHRVETNGQKLLCGNGLLGALAIRGLVHIDVGEKEAMRRLVCDQRRWSPAEQSPHGLFFADVNMNQPANGEGSEQTISAEQFLAIRFEPMLCEQINDVGRQRPTELQKAPQLGRAVIGDECRIRASVERGFPECEQLVAPQIEFSARC